MEWWIKEEIDKYKNKKVEYNGYSHIVKEVFWKESEEEFIYWIEDSKRNLHKVFENNIKLVG
jgi:hypothetical protein